MARASQRLTLFTIKNKDKKSKGTIIAINKNSIGTIIVNGKPYSYNLDKVNTTNQNNSELSKSNIKKQAEQKKKKLIILIKRK